MIPKRIHFTKLTSAGNDFVLLDNTKGVFDDLIASDLLPEFVCRICKRGLAVGADGVIFACQLGGVGGVDIVARFLEPDGSEAQLCGNGTACFTYWAVSSGLVPGPELRLLTAAGTAKGTFDTEDRGRVEVCVPNPRDLAMGIEVDINGKTWQLDYLHNGVPHVIAFVDQLDTLDVAHLGSVIRHHPRFQPQGVNANFVEVLDVGHIAIRTFEFGVEAETLACGTGSAAAAIISCLRFDWPQAYRLAEKSTVVNVRSGEHLHICFICETGDRITDVCLDTRARAIYDAELRPEFMAELHTLVSTQ